MCYYVVNTCVLVAQRELANDAIRCFLREDSCAWGWASSSSQRQTRCDRRKTNKRVL